MGVLNGYEPAAVFRFFEEICSIPHGSGNTAQISDYLVNFAKERNLSYKQDAKGNVIIWKDGTSGYESSNPVILQGHMDMVTVKVDTSNKNLETEGLDLAVLDGDWISAVDTSLGGDDGIAIAYALALLDSDSIPHPPIEEVITVDEEIGMLGANALDCSGLKGRMMLNIDSEDEGIFTVSCAGGLSAIAHLPFQTETKSGTLIRMKVTGFRGGHSGAEINKGRLNSNLVVGRMLNSLANPDVQIVSVTGGEKDNAISKITEVELLVSDTQAKSICEALNAKLKEIAAEYASVESGLENEFTIEAVEEAECMTVESTKKVISALLNIPNGIQRMNPEMPDMVQTSLNLGIVNTNEKEVLFCSALRSASATEKQALYERMENFFAMLGGTVECAGEYPGWEYLPESRLRDTLIEAYREQYKAEPVVEGIHAGLECGIFASRLPGLDVVSIGPQMHDIHTTNEVLSIASTSRTWELIKTTLAKLK